MDFLDQQCNLAYVHLLIMAISSFSTIGGLCLVFMIPEYNPFKRKNKTILIQTKALSSLTTFHL